MSAERNDQQEDFFGRWSRMKTEAREAPAAPVEPPPALTTADDAPPELPPLDKLTIDSDFRGFFHPKVDEDMRRAALRKLFSDPHFNVMDGLDVYIDDYSKTEPIPAAMLAGMKQAQRILNWASNKDEEADDAEKPSEVDAENNAAGAPRAAPAVEDTASQPPLELAHQPDPVGKLNAGS